MLIAKKKSYLQVITDSNKDKMAMQECIVSSCELTSYKDA